MRKSLVTGMKKSLILLAFFVSTTLWAQDLQPVPELWQRVTDLTGTLNNTQIGHLESKLAAFERQKGAQIAILILPTTDPEPIEDYSIRLADKWKIGRGGMIDDGVIIVIAKNDRRIRIEVGYGLEGAIPDALASQIINDHITPRFREGNFFEGINVGVEAIIKLVEGEPLPEPVRATDGEKEFPYFFLVVVFVIIGQVLGIKLGKWKGISLGAVISLIAGLIIAGLGAALVMLIMYGFISFFTLFTGRGGGGRGGYYGGGFGGFGGGRGGFGGGGGFSGGGGGFGGGGASGSW